MNPQAECRAKLCQQSFVAVSDLAAPFAETLTDPNQRNSAIENIARNWLRTDPAAAEKWLANTSLPDQQKQNLLNSVKK